MKFQKNDNQTMGQWKKRKMIRRISNDAAEAWAVGFQDSGT